MQSLVLGQIKTQELIGGASRRQSILGFYVLVHLATAIVCKNCCFSDRAHHQKKPTVWGFFFISQEPLAKIAALAIAPITKKKPALQVSFLHKA
ncbi:hypothetical protein APA_3874 [Pseudanabaena sp. lw0831]|nr:hypothetical protein APA_3874 [Pseudanabaena sp. lw0831]